MRDSQILLGFYGESLASSLDFSMKLALNGLPVALFTQAPSASTVEKFRLKDEWNQNQLFGRIGALGLLGNSAQMSPEEMEEKLPEVLEDISDLNAGFFQYVTDYALHAEPSHGSIGHAIDLAYEFYPSNFIPLLMAAPSENCLSVFGCLFKKEKGNYQMLKKDANTASNSDVQAILAKQTYRPVKLFDVFSLEIKDNANWVESFRDLHTESGEFILFDILKEEHLQEVGKLVCELKKQGTQLLAGSSGMAEAICAYFQHSGKLMKPSPPASPGPVDTLVAVVERGENFPQAQLDWCAQQDRYKIFEINPANKEEQIAQALAQKGKNIIFVLENGSKDFPHLFYGKTFRSFLENLDFGRVFISPNGGAIERLSKMDVQAMETLYPLGYGLPICLLHSTRDIFNNKQLVIGDISSQKEDFIERIRIGK
ncbi:four-carbon acid sugar kinase family protein [Flammeovirgaceae bacterium SG7u.111]|nr:four-carbon acid sugar kinase family protein [Flammeovirgaceae bacterium SG7u.132]WPO38334.1 four-carbon acid sugar kinase family protein [Flammeovirgaceae bacterium SG7u.111]